MKFLNKCAYNDLKIFEILFEEISSDFDIHLANSTPVRYAQLFADQLNNRMYSNRGTSGIDGSISTSAGSALTSNRPTVVISGDLGFFYDSNALWNSKLPSNLKIILINNGGGGIFRFLPGPDTTGLLESHFEARHQLRADGLAKTFGLLYFTADSEESLKQILPSFLLPGESASILEIISPAEESAATLRTYFSSMNH
jgi:2-succinyl-5-enolpyruvyl-6-hydroxy-3-cyclohexene-1-carboxylate synthase